jgi:hypothetical protein
MDDENYIEAEATFPTRLQYSTIRLRAGRFVDPGTGDEGRARAWDNLADELAAQAARQAERIVTRFERDRGKANGNGGH